MAINEYAMCWMGSVVDYLKYRWIRSSEFNRGLD